jgi:molybdate transport system ATP-binding protein
MTAVFEAEFAKRFPNGPLIEARFSFPADRFGVTVLFGPSGAGKTTVLRCVAGLERPDAGHIGLGGHHWYDCQQRICLPPQRRDIGFLSQDHALFPHLTIAENITYGLKGIARAEQYERAVLLLRLLGLAGLEKRYPRQLSRGQQQRVALARAVARRPRLLLLDEPLSALDAPTRAQLRRKLRAWLQEMDVSTIMVTHDLTEAMTLGDSLVVMDQGRICQVGPVEQVLAHPASLAVARIVGVDTLERGTVMSATQGRAVIRVRGTEVVAQTDTVKATEVLVCIRAEDVQLSTATEANGTVDNQLPCIVQTVTRDGQLLRVSLDCGFPLVAVVPPQVGANLRLCLGAPVVALLRAGSIHLIDEAL